MSRVYSSKPSASAALSQLHIGSVDPSILGSYTKVNSGNVEVWHLNNGGYTKNTIFGVMYRGKKTFLKNMLSKVSVDGDTSYAFRNPPHHLNIGVREPRDAMYETDAVLATYFYNDNVAPFLAQRTIQRFGISNPSPRYIEAVSTAFRDGTYTNQGQSFGDGTYGNLGAMVAAIVLDREARTVIVDADPASGSLREPILKLIGLMKAMEFQNRDNLVEVRLENLQGSIGQEPHLAPNVFSFFLPRYSPKGHIKAASLTSPEAQILTAPKIIGTLNGLMSTVDFGLARCDGGFGQVYGGCGWPADPDQNLGMFKFLPSNPNNAADVVN
jgi:hypothetical protein